MKQETQTLQVFRDGELDQDYLAIVQSRERHERLANIGHGTLHIVQATASYMARMAAKEALTCIAIMSDHINETGTTQRQEIEDWFKPDAQA